VDITFGAAAESLKGVDTSSCACSLTVFKLDASTKQYLSAMPPPADPRRATMIDGGIKRREPSSLWAHTNTIEAVAQ
jgi:hypothetical protein